MNVPYAIKSMDNTIEHLSSKLKVASPFRLDLTTWALRRRSNNIMDRWVDRSWRRVLVFKEKPIEIVVNQKLLQDNNMLHVRLVGLRLEDNSKKDLGAILEKCLVAGPMGFEPTTFSLEG